MYYYATYEFKGLKVFYAAWLREIELGKKTWSDDSQQIENAILSKYLLKGTKSKPSAATKNYQVNKYMRMTGSGSAPCIKETNVSKDQII